MHEAGDAGLASFPAATAAATTELAVPGQVRYLAMWRLSPEAPTGDDPVWERIRRAAAPAPAHLYVPAFSMARPVVQRLGVRLTEVQPVLELTEGAPAGHSPRPALVEAGMAFGVGVVALSGSAALAAAPGSAAGSPAGEPEFETVSPVLIGRREARGLAHFIYMGVEAREAHELPTADLGLRPEAEELLFLPAVWDPRCIHESNWRLLLREFDGLVA